LANKEGLEDAAYWFESVGSADTKHKNRFAKALKEVP
jgi:rubrerythrin